MYVSPNFKTKKSLREAVARGDAVRVWSPGPFPAPRNSSTTVEGPHYPEPHTWYAVVDMVEGIVKKVR